MNRVAIISCLLIFVAALATAQVPDFAEPLPEEELVAPPAIDERLQLAVADPSYPVTPGDLYSLGFLQGIELVTLQLLVESDYTINLGVIGEVDARNRTFSQLKPQVEALVAQAYPRSLPSLNITSIGLFQVTLSGAIPQTRRIVAWGLSRLSDVIEGTTGPYTSLRRVTVASSGGRRQSYDLFRAIDQGEMNQDPLLKPGDAISFSRQERVVAVHGEAYEPGVYEILATETLPELRQYFQDFTPNADTTRLVVQRQAGETVQQIPLGPIQEANRFRFQNGDLLLIPTKVIPRPVVYIEGAVQLAFDLAPEPQEDSSIPVYNRVTRGLTVGDTLYSLLLDIQDQISPFADIERGYIIREGQADPIRINMRQVLYRQSEHNDFVLLPFDRIVIPLDQPFVIVSGDVSLPSRYPYNPGEGYAYYLNLAGTGAESFLEVRDRVRIYDRDGNQVEIDQAVQSGFTVHVPTIDAVVVVSGDVPVPGAYDYEPNRQFIYYLRQAGVGAEALPSLDGRLQFFDAAGAAVESAPIVPPDYTIYVPPREEGFVVVSGDVPDPGAYPYDPSRDFSYYLLLAGVGAEALAAERSTVLIYDETGSVISRGSGILPEYTVHVPPTEEALSPEGAFVLVSGAVNAPGLYPLFGERGASYYIQQAGGINNEISGNGEYQVTSAAGESREGDAIIASGDSIEVLRNGFVYNFNRYFPIITAGLTFITTIIAIVNALNP